MGNADGAATAIPAEAPSPDHPAGHNFYSLFAAWSLLSCDAKMLRDCKKLIDEGYEMPLSDAPRHQAETAIRSAASVTAGEIASRREGVMARVRKRSAT